MIVSKEEIEFIMTLKYNNEFKMNTKKNEPRNHWEIKGLGFMQLLQFIDG